MANAQASPIPARLGRSTPPPTRASRVARRRRLLLLGAGALVFSLAVMANYGPLHAYMDAKARLNKTVHAVAELEATKAGLQSELGRLSEADYLESLAREDLSYARPGEKLYIVAGGDEGTWQSGGVAGDERKRRPGGAGFLEWVLSPLLDGR